MRKIGRSSHDDRVAWFMVGCRSLVGTRGVARSIALERAPSRLFAGSRGVSASCFIDNCLLACGSHFTDASRGQVAKPV